MNLQSMNEVEREKILGDRKEKMVNCKETFELLIQDSKRDGKV
jgi:hypothetical protein